MALSERDLVPLRQTGAALSGQMSLANENPNESHVTTFEASRLVLEIVRNAMDRLG
jgi:hypothetical protein